jgi:hypothetical protein
MATGFARPSWRWHYGHVSRCGEVENKDTQPTRCSRKLNVLESSSTTILRRLCMRTSHEIPLLFRLVLHGFFALVRTTRLRLILLRHRRELLICTALFSGPVAEGKAVKRNSA